MLYLSKLSQYRRLWYLPMPNMISIYKFTLATPSAAATSLTNLHGKTPLQHHFRFRLLQLDGKLRPSAGAGIPSHGENSFTSGDSCWSGNLARACLVTIFWRHSTQSHNFYLNFCVNLLRKKDNLIDH